MHKKYVLSLVNNIFVLHVNRHPLKGTLVFFHFQQFISLKFLLLIIKQIHLYGKSNDLMRIEKDDEIFEYLECRFVTANKQY